jgi:hypothetical protein
MDGWELRQQWPTTSASTGPQKAKTINRWIYDQDPQSPTCGKPSKYGTRQNPSTTVQVPASFTPLLRARATSLSDLQTPIMTQTRLCTAQQVKGQDHGFGVSWASYHTFPRWRCRSAASLTMHEFNDAAIAKPSRDINHGTLDRPWSRVVRRRRRPDGDSPRRSAKGGSETAAD